MWGFTGILGVLIDLDAFYIVWHRVLIAFIALAIGLIFMKTSAVSSLERLRWERTSVFFSFVLTGGMLISFGGGFEGAAAVSEYVKARRA